MSRFGIFLSSIMGLALILGMATAEQYSESDDAPAIYANSDKMTNVRSMKKLVSFADGTLREKTVAYRNSTTTASVTR